MSPSAAPSAQDAPDSDPAVARAERRLVRLDDFADLALELARAQQRKALEQLNAAPEAPAPRGPDPVLAFDRAGRALRRALALQARLEDDLVARRDAAARAPAPRPEPAAPTPAPEPTPGERRKAELRDFVEAAIDDTLDGRERLFTLADLADRFDDLDPDDLDLDKPFGAVLAEICRDLGVEPDWRKWECRPWAIDEVRKAAPGSPFAPRPPRAPSRPTPPAGRPLTVEQAAAEAAADHAAALRDRLDRLRILKAFSP